MKKPAGKTICYRLEGFRRAVLLERFTTVHVGSFFVQFIFFSSNQSVRSPS